MIQLNYQTNISIIFSKRTTSDHTENSNKQMRQERSGPTKECYQIRQSENKQIIVKWEVIVQKESRIRKRNSINNQIRKHHQQTCTNKKKFLGSVTKGKEIIYAHTHITKTHTIYTQTHT